jgi:hypothetical protein
LTAELAGNIEKKISKLKIPDSKKCGCPRFKRFLMRGWILSFLNLLSAPSAISAVQFLENQETTKEDEIG